MNASANSCLTCGACCTYYRISSYWGECGEAPSGSVPAEFTEKVHEHMVCMKGTNSYPPRRIALRGEVG